MKTLNDYAKECHKANIRWWQDPATGEPIERDKGELLMLMISEVAECMEGERKGKMDDHLPHRRSAEVELADLLIRIFDYAGAFGIDLSIWEFDEPTTLNQLAIEACMGKSPNPHKLNRAAFLRGICRELAWDKPDMVDLDRALFKIFRYAGFFRYDLDGAYEEKMSYNAVRADHTHAARQAAGGKKW